MDAVETNALLQATADLILVLDREGRYLKVHSGRRKQLYRDPAELLGRLVSDVIPSEAAQEFLRVIHRTLDTRETQRLEYSLDIGGEELWFAARIAPASNTTVVWVARDITEQRRNAEALRASEAGHRELLASLPVIAYWVAPRAPYEPLYVSPGVEILGYTHDEWLRHPDMWLTVIHPDDRDRIVAETEAAVASGTSIEYDYRVVAKDGAIRWIHDRGQIVRDSAGEPMAWRGVMIDITDRRQLEERLAALSEQDELTGLLNRRGFRRLAEQALRMESRARRRVGLVYIDLDDFKPVNDRHGHAVGDLALQHVASVLREGVRSCDVVGRFGGDEFVILVTDLREEGECDLLAQRLRDRLLDLRASHPELPSHRVTFSYGCIENVGNNRLDELLNQADAALGERKARRRPAGA